MKYSLIGAAAVALTATAALAATYNEFHQEYEGLVQFALSHGFSPQRVCFPKYCATQMSFTDGSGNIIFLANVSQNDGLSFQEFCKGNNTVRSCAGSDGMVWREQNNGSKWITIETIATHFDE